jgi:hypothetical protein
MLMDARMAGSILGVRAGAGEREIKSAYRRKALEFHPDSHGGTKEGSRFIQAAAAYEFLMSARRPAGCSDADDDDDMRVYPDPEQEEAFAIYSECYELARLLANYGLAAAELLKDIESAMKEIEAGFYARHTEKSIDAAYQFLARQK